MSHRLVIVESPTKARTLSRILGSDFVVESSVGHIRDLPQNASEIPAKYKGKEWRSLGVNVDEDFEPLYVVSPAKKKKVSELKGLLADADELLLATDEDREGEAISWHLLEVLKPKIPTRRMVFHEITREAVERALTETRPLDERLVRAQEARRILDRLVGYGVSPLLWKKVFPGLSAGRVQSVAVRMVVLRERARMRFVSASFWSLAAQLEADGTGFETRVARIGPDRIANGKDFDPDTGTCTKKGVVVLDEAAAQSLVEQLSDASYKVTRVERKPWSQSPPPPFTTSTLQQEGGRKFRFAASRTMRAAQRLYENGLITYMRTDSTNLSKEALSAAREVIEGRYGTELLPSEPRLYRTKVKNAQEAHEAIRPAGSEWATPADVRGRFGADEARVYELIWKRTLASQMVDAGGQRVSVSLLATAAGMPDVTLNASGRTVTQPGFFLAYVEGTDDPQADLADRERILPTLNEGQTLSATEVRSDGRTTQPPPRLTEATLIRELEVTGIGRPSTYASILDTIQGRGYVSKKGNALVPSFTAFAVTKLLEEHLVELVDAEFTAKMEDRLDSISRGDEEWLPYLQQFYFGQDGGLGLKELLAQKLADINPREVCTIPLGEDSEGRAVAVRVGRWGPYLERAKQTAPLPDEILPDELNPTKASEIIDSPMGKPRELGTHPETGEVVLVRGGRFGPYVQLGEVQKAKKGAKKPPKPKTQSLLPGMHVDTVDLEAALKLLSLPRALGKNADGKEVQAGHGRYGPYVSCAGEYRSLKEEDDVFTVGLNRALALLAESNRKANAPKVLKDFGEVEALKGAQVRVMAGRFGPYVSDGSVNASLPKDFEDPAKLEIAQALELLEARRAKLASGGGRRKRTTRRKRS